MSGDGVWIVPKVSPLPRDTTGNVVPKNILFYFERDGEAFEIVEASNIVFADLVTNNWRVRKFPLTTQVSDH